MARGGARQGAGRKRKDPNAPKKARGNKGKTSSKPGESAQAHKWLMGTLKEEAKPEPTPPQHEAPKRLPANAWLPGQSGNPAGRPKGSRNKLGEAFIADFYADWLKHGADVIQAVRTEKPDQYLKVAASILPKELKVNVGEYDELSDDELDRRIRALAAAISLEIGIGEGARGEEAAHGAQPARGVSALQ